MFEFLVPAKRPQNVVRVKITSGAFVKPWDGPIRSCSPGEFVDCSSQDAASLVSSGRGEALGQVGANGELLPPKFAEKRMAIPEYEPKPYPEAWAELPKVFRAAWDAEQELTRLRTDLRNLVESQGKGFLIGKAHVGESGKTFAEKIIRAEDRLRAFNREGMERALFECSSLTLSEIRGANATRDEVAALGFRLFSLRLEALGLHESKVRSLFPGSVLFMKYASLESITEGGLRSAGGGVVYMDVPLEAMAAYIRRARALRAEAIAKLEEAKAELAAATGSTPRKFKAAS